MSFTLTQYKYLNLVLLDIFQILLSILNKSKKFVFNILFLFFVYVRGVQAIFHPPQLISFVESTNNWSPEILLLSGLDLRRSKSNRIF